MVKDLNVFCRRKKEQFTARVITGAPTTRVESDASAHRRTSKLLPSGAAGAPSGESRTESDRASPPSSGIQLRR